MVNCHANAFEVCTLYFVLGLSTNGPGVLFLSLPIIAHSHAPESKGKGDQGTNKPRKLPLKKEESDQCSKQSDVANFLNLGLVGLFFLPLYCV